MTAQESTQALCEHLRGESLRLGRLSGRLVPSTEREFLELGRRLQEFWERSNEISRLAADCAEATSGSDMEQAIAAMNQELEEMAGMCRSELSRDSIDQLERIDVVVTGLAGVLGEFKRIVRKLQMLGISTRIESARLGATGRGFTTLADDVEKLGLTIVEHSAKITAKSDLLVAHIASARERTELMLDKQTRCASEVFSRIQADMDSLGGLADRSREAAANLPARAGEIGKSVQEVVQSLQFHDIVRQQVEHVEQAMDDASQELAGCSSVDEEEAVRLVSFCSDITALQLSQVRNARDRFTGALASIRDNLSAIADTVRAMVGDLEDASGEGSGDKLLLRVRESIGEVMTGIRSFTEQGQAMALTMREVAGTVGDMADFVGDIEEVGSEIELIALNASIKAAHTGSEGAALGVLAMAIQGLSVEAREMTGRVSDILKAITEVSDRLQSNASSFLRTDEVDGVLAKFRDLMDLLGETNHKVSRALNALSGQGGELAADLRATAERTDFDAGVDEGLLAVERGMESMLARIQREVPHVDEGRQPERLRAMLERYTMEAERDIYRKTFGAVAGDADVFFDDAPVQAGGGDFGDNVELF